MINQHIVTGAFIHKDGKLLTVKRADTEDFLPGIFELPGGHLEEGEELHSSLQREIGEELGIAIVVGQLVGAFTYQSKNNVQTVDLVYLATMADDQQPIVLNPEEHSTHRWVGSSEADRLFQDNPSMHKIVLNGFSLIRGSHE